jgi:hypothetical protein
MGIFFSFPVVFPLHFHFYSTTFVEVEFLKTDFMEMDGAASAAPDFK